MNAFNCTVKYTLLFLKNITYQFSNFTILVFKFYFMKSETRHIIKVILLIGELFLNVNFTRLEKLQLLKKYLRKPSIY